MGCDGKWNHGLKPAACGPYPDGLILTHTQLKQKLRTAAPGTRSLLRHRRDHLQTKANGQISRFGYFYIAPYEEFISGWAKPRSWIRKEHPVQ